jgi:polynucleotide 5'-kinase involved in rRNA processing
MNLENRVLALKDLSGKGIQIFHSKTEEDFISQVAKQEIRTGIKFNTYYKQLTFNTVYIVSYDIHKEELDGN